MSNCYVKFWENSNYSDDGGGYKTFNGPGNCSDLSNHHWVTGDGDTHDSWRYEMDDSISSLQTGSNAWVVLYTQKDYAGSSYLVGPSTTLHDLSDLGGHDFNNNIESYQLFDGPPVDTHAVIENFHALYPGTENNQDDKHYSKYYAQDSEYKMADPAITQDETNGYVSFDMIATHIRTGGDNDTAEIQFKMNYNGSYRDKITVDYTMSSGAYHVPQWMIDLADDAVDAMADDLKVETDVAEEVVSDGLLTEMIPLTNLMIDGLADGVKFLIDHVNNIIDFMFGLSDDGGTMNFSTVVAHGIARLSRAFMEAQFGKTTDLLSFNLSTFQNEIGQTLETETFKHNPSAIFSHNNCDYRVYYPDNTPLYGKSGLLSTVKIDAINNNEKDDHLILHLLYDSTGKLLVVNGTIDIYGAPNSDDYDSSTDEYKAPNSGNLLWHDGQIKMLQPGTVSVVSGYSNLEDAYEGQMQNALDNVAYVDHSGYSDALKSLVGASRYVLDAINAAIDA